VQIKPGGKNDQFNPWMDVDPKDGAIQVAYYDTKADPTRRKTRVHYVASSDGGAKWSAPKVINGSAIDETVAGANFGNQYGDYNGLAAAAAVVHPVWTHRNNTATSREEIRTIRVTPIAVSAKECGAGPGGDCPKAETAAVSRFGQYKEGVPTLPKDQQAELDAISKRIASGFAAGCKPVKGVDLAGHADRDNSKTRKFENDLSKKRAEQVRSYIQKQLGKNAPKVKFTIKALGSSQMKFPTPASELQHEENRRVVINLKL
jgi:outer membrane protein OmpA-like peptidoglycan-associated protein